MKVFLSVDMEGICGIVHEKQTDPYQGGREYEEACRLMTAEANAAIQGCVDAGADDILVADSHWDFRNLIPEELHEAATLLRGKPRALSMAQGLDTSFDAAMYIGYHAMAGTSPAILDHTWSGRIRTVEVNKKVVGETAINAYLAGHHGVLVTGDARLAAEARSFLPGVHTVAVKDPVGRGAAANLHPKRAQEFIRAEAKKALEDRKAIRPVTAKAPVAMAVDFTSTESADLGALLPTTRRVGATRIEWTSKDFAEAYRTFVALAYLSRP